MNENEKGMVDLYNQEMRELQANQKQIEEMAKDLYGHICGKVKCQECKYNGDSEILGPYCPDYTRAKHLIKKGYRKIPENAVVLTREEYNKLEKKIADLSYDADFHKQQEERIVDLQYDKFELKQEISEKDNKIALLEETIDCIKFNVDFTRKETAEKFALKLADYFVEHCAGRLSISLTLQEWYKMIDDIEKEITEGKV